MNLYAILFFVSNIASLNLVYIVVSQDDLIKVEMHKPALVRKERLGWERDFNEFRVWFEGTKTVLQFFN